MILEDVVDKGNFYLYKYKLIDISYVLNELKILFNGTDDDTKLVFNLRGVASFDVRAFEEVYNLFRVDSDGSSYGFDIAVRLRKPELKDYMVLYFFKEEHHVPVFRALSKEISLTRF